MGAGLCAGDNVLGFVAVDGEVGILEDGGSGVGWVIIELADGVSFLGGTAGGWNVSGRFGSRRWDDDGAGGTMEDFVGCSWVEVERQRMQGGC